MHIVSRICNLFPITVFIYNYCFICENLPYIRRHKLIDAIVVFYNKMFYSTIFEKVISETTR